MVNTVTKGRKAELELRRHLESKGWLVHQAVRSRWRGTDLFGVFDLAAINDQGYTSYFQVTDPTNAAKHKREIEALFDGRIAPPIYLCLRYGGGAWSVLSPYVSYSGLARSWHNTDPSWAIGLKIHVPVAKKPRIHRNVKGSS